MTTIVKSLGDLVNLIAQTFNLSTLFPALLLVILIQMFLLPILPADSLYRFLDINGENGLQIWLNLILVALLAYLLDAANLSLIRLFEGYPLRGVFPFDLMERSHRSYVERILREVNELYIRYQDVRKRLNEEHPPDEKERLQQQADDLADQLNLLFKHVADRYPQDPSEVLPTPFGNVIAAAEHYPYKILGMDPVALWPFLRPIMNEEGYAPFILRDKAVMDFLVNLITVLTVFCALFGFVNWYYNGLQIAWLGKILLIGLCCFLLYLLSVQAAAGWGITIRTPFVLYREQLRRRLCLRPVLDYEDECRLWQDASAFFSGELTEEEQQAIGTSIFTPRSYQEHIKSGG